MWYAWPMGVWFTVFFAAPIAIIILYSFLKKGLYGGVVNHVSFAAYRQILNPSYALVLFRTVWCIRNGKKPATNAAFAFGYSTLLDKLAYPHICVDVYFRQRRTFKYAFV